jgi:ubiquinone/menaquinone biosynthesis C-methylase UbiE
MHDPVVIERELGLRSGECFLDLGCGAGDYALRAAELVGQSGTVLALDRDERGIDRLALEAAERDLNNVRTLVADFTGALPIEDGCVDVCLIATALHMVPLEGIGHSLFAETRRVLRTGGRLVVIECKKEDAPCGPPLWLRNAPAEIETLVLPCGFAKVAEVDLGYNYLLRFVAL